MAIKICKALRNFKDTMLIDDENLYPTYISTNSHFKVYAQPKPKAIKQSRIYTNGDGPESESEYSNLLFLISSQLSVSSCLIFIPESEDLGERELSLLP